MIIQGKVWGQTSPVFNKNNVEIHFMKIKKGGFCSKHLHRFKFNRFIVLEGKLKVTIWKDYGNAILDDVSILEGSHECTVPPGYYHKFEALEETRAIEIYWVELSEDDIERSDHGGVSLHETQTNIISQADGKSLWECTCGSHGECLRSNRRKYDRPATGFHSYE